MPLCSLTAQTCTTGYLFIFDYPTAAPLKFYTCCDQATPPMKCAATTQHYKVNKGTSNE